MIIEFQPRVTGTSGCCHALSLFFAFLPLRSSELGRSKVDSFEEETVEVAGGPNSAGISDPPSLRERATLA